MPMRMDLIRTSALNASVRLKFARLAFGASGSVGASIDTGEAEKAAKDFASVEKKTEVTWTGPRVIIAKNRVKLLLNLFLIAYGAIPRGGSIDVILENPEYDAVFKLIVQGPDDARAAEVRRASRPARSKRLSMPIRSSPITPCCSLTRPAWRSMINSNAEEIVFAAKMAAA